jgi:hypothetical protein
MEIIITHMEIAMETTRAITMVKIATAILIRMKVQILRLQ